MGGRKPFSKTSTPLHDLRLENNLTIKDVAELMDMSPAEVSKMFNGKKKITPVHKEKIMNIFDLGYNQVCDICNRMDKTYYRGDLRTRKKIEVPEEVVEESEVIETSTTSDLGTSDIQHYNPLSGEYTHEEYPPNMYSIYPTTVEKSKDVAEDTNNKHNIVEGILDLVYGKVSREDYESIIKLLQAW